MATSKATLILRVLAIVGVVAIAVCGIVYTSNQKRKGPFASSPTSVRPWAETEWDFWCSPTASAGRAARPGVLLGRFHARRQRRPGDRHLGGFAGVASSR